MREIKFRAWDNKKNRWLTNYENCYLNEHGDVLIEIDKSCGTIFRIQDATAEQYTGLKDKNGKEIYEGDIVEAVILSGRGDITVSGVIKYIIPDCLYVIDENKESSFSLQDIRLIEIIDNIHENPKRLKAGKE